MELLLLFGIGPLLFAWLRSTALAPPIAPSLLALAGLCGLLLRHKAKARIAEAWSAHALYGCCVDTVGLGRYFYAC